MRHSPLPRARAAMHELARAHDAARCAARDAREHRHVEDADRDDRGHQPGPVDRGQHDRREQRREGEGEVGQAHHHLLDPAAPAPRRAGRGATPKTMPMPTAIRPTAIETAAADDAAARRCRGRGCRCRASAPRSAPCSLFGMSSSAAGTASRRTRAAPGRRRSVDQHRADREAGVAPARRARAATALARRRRAHVVALAPAGADR